MTSLHLAMTSWRFYTKYWHWHKVASKSPDDSSQRSSTSESHNPLLEESQEKSFRFPERTRKTPLLIFIYSAIGLVVIAAVIFSISISVSRSTRGSHEPQRIQADVNLLNLKDPVGHGGKQPILYLDPSHNYSLKSPCGRSPDEARRAGCHFELFSFSWVPDECYDLDLVQSFNAVQEWSFWLNQDGTGPISQQEAQTGNYDALYTTWRYHLRHCTAMWQKMHKALLGNGYSGIDSIVANLGHTEHCSERLLMQDIPMDQIISKAMRGFPDCGLLHI